MTAFNTSKSSSNNNTNKGLLSRITNPSRFFSSLNKKKSPASITIPSSIRGNSIISSSASSSSSLQSDDDYIPVEVRRFSTAYKKSNKSDAREFSTASSGSSKLSSNRANRAIQLLPSYLIDARSIIQYSKDTPDGALQLSVAENQLSELIIPNLFGILEHGSEGEINNKQDGKEMKLVEVLSQLAKSTKSRPGVVEGEKEVNVFDTDMIYYQPTQGVPSLRIAMGDYLQRLLVNPTSSSTGSDTTRKFNPDNIILGAGCNAVLENLCMCLANPGDGVLIPTPYYAAFEFDLVARAGCHIVPVNTFDCARVDNREGVPEYTKGEKDNSISPEYYYPNVNSLEMAYQRTISETGRPPRVLLLSHPNNPLGICYPGNVMKECIDWCREKEVHLISDEIYAGSVYRKERMKPLHWPISGKVFVEGEDTFVSAMSLASGSSDDASSTEEGLGLGPYIHLVYAFSKDFALSGLRVGVAYTENEEILMPMQKLNDLCQISSQTQLLVERMLCANAIMGKEQVDTSQKFVDVYLKSSHDNIRDRCDRLQSCLDEVGIPYLNADSGLFIWMDFREFLPALSDGITEATETLESKEQRERQLYLSLMKEYGLLFTPGMSMRNERAGFFRCVFTAASEDEFELGLTRLRKFVEERRK